jgi:hypothetical protein
MRDRVVKYVGWALVIPSLLALVHSVLQADATRRAIGAVQWLDWLTYANAAERFFTGGRLYDSVQLAGPYLLPHVVLIGYAYPPPSVFLVAPFAGGVTGLVTWPLLNACLLVSGVTAILRVSMRLSLPWALALTAMSLSFYSPFANGMAAGNINVGLAGLFAWSWVLHERRKWLGAVAGLVSLTKVFPGFLVAWSWRSHGWSQFRDAALVAGGISLVTLPLVGVDSWADFVRAIANAKPGCAPQTVSFACTLGPVIGSDAARVIGIAIGLAAFAGAMVVRSPFVAFALVGFAMLAPVADMWIHYWLFPYVVIVAGLAYVLGPRFAADRHPSVERLHASTPD